MKFLLNTSLALCGLLAVADAYPNIAQHLAETESKKRANKEVERLVHMIDDLADMIGSR